VHQVATIDTAPAHAEVSTITLPDGFLIAAFDGLPASASRVL
jgi:hypothetical protein